MLRSGIWLARWIDAKVDGMKRWSILKRRENLILEIVRSFGIWPRLTEQLHGTKKRNAYRMRPFQFIRKAIFLLWRARRTNCARRERPSLYAKLCVRFQRTLIREAR